MEQNEITAPAHYSLHDGYDASDVMSECMSIEQVRGYWRGNVLKYAVRLGRKGSDVDTQKDAKKLLECATRLCECYQ